MALAHSRSLDQLKHAEWVFSDFSEVDLGRLAEEFQRP